MVVARVLILVTLPVDREWSPYRRYESAFSKQNNQAGDKVSENFLQAKPNNAERGHQPLCFDHSMPSSSKPARQSALTDIW
ncbi:hypothetical protein KCP69_00335 [Salmonella enterica subsp. enterica]|nr:hypothetical protein KCP69_00335 [Salmonella enterica subsp. enterica]